MSHSSMLKARRKHQKTRKSLHAEAKQAKRMTKTQPGRPDATKSTMEAGQQGGA